MPRPVPYHQAWVRVTRRIGYSAAGQVMHVEAETTRAVWPILNAILIKRLW